MANITIENYRGIEIWFDTGREVFQCDIDDDRSVKPSYTSIKKFIDDWKKLNLNFTPFKVMPNPNGNWGSESIKKVVGQTKDGRFIGEREDGKREIISKCNEHDYMLFNTENIPFFEELELVKKDRETARIEHNAREKTIKEKMVIKTLSDFKKEI